MRTTVMLYTYMWLRYIEHWARRWRFKECNSIAFELRNAPNCMQLYDVLVCVCIVFASELFLCMNFLVIFLDAIQTRIWQLKLIHKFIELNFILDFLHWLLVVVLLLVKMHVEMLVKKHVFVYFDAYRSDLCFRIYEKQTRKKNRNTQYVKRQTNSMRHLYEADSARVWSFMAFAYVK